MILPLRIVQGALNAIWRATHREQKALVPTTTTVPGTGGWVGLIRESFAGAWQTNTEIRTDTVLTHSAVFRCIGLISGDIAKMRIRLVEQSSDGIWTEVTNPAFSPVLRKPNRYQNRIQFFSTWAESKLIYGNTYVLKERDARNVVVRLYVLNPELVTVRIAPDGGVYYELRTDWLAGIEEVRILVPASEIIHDRWNTLTHPLVGTSPIHACGLAALQGLHIQANSQKFFQNGSTPGGILTAPNAISNETAERLKAYWETNYTGNNVGKVAVLGDGLKYEAMSVTAADSQLLEQLKWTAETVASVFGVPAFKIGAGEAPTYNNIEALDAQYYSQCLQIHIESIELCLDEGLGLGPAFGNSYGTEFDLDDLLRMDTATQIKTMGEGVKNGILAPDEARAKVGYGKVEGGATPYLQVQNYSLAALARRDATSNPMTPGLDSAAGPPTEVEEDDDGGDEERSHLAADIYRRSLRGYVPASP